MVKKEDVFRYYLRQCLRCDKIYKANSRGSRICQTCKVKSIFKKMMNEKKMRKLEIKERKRKDREWSMAVKLRDNWCCVICGNKNKLNSHHIIPREIKELRHDLMNGISLCPNHHNFSRVCSPHNNSFVFYLWLLRNRPEQYNYLEKIGNKDVNNLVNSNNIYKQ